MEVACVDRRGGGKQTTFYGGCEDGAGVSNGCSFG